MQSKDPYSVASLNAVSGNSPVTPVCPAPGKHNPSPPPSEREVRTREGRRFEVKLSHHLSQMHLDNPERFINSRCLPCRGLYCTLRPRLYILRCVHRIE